MIEEYESILGKILEGWSDTTAPDTYKMQVVKTLHFRNAGVFIYSTLGLSSFPLRRGTEKVDYFLEFSICITSDSKQEWIPGTLMALAENISQGGIAPIRGDILNVPPININGTVVSAFYVTTPLFLDDGARVIFSGEKEIPVVWIIPLTKGEAKFSLNIGWHDFEDYLENFLDHMTRLPRSEISA